MSGTHTHEHDHQIRAPRRLRWILAAVLAPLGALILVGVVGTWPKAVTVPQNTDLAQQADLYDANAVTVQMVSCGGSIQCQQVDIELTSGPEAGRRITLPQVA